ncbi:MAG TPA: iron uptake porin, partial [Allocoleopsis sp.]
MKLAFRVLWQSFIAAPTLLGVLLILSTSAIATEIPPRTNSEVSPATRLATRPDEDSPDEDSPDEASNDATNSEVTAVEPDSDLPLSVQVANPLESDSSSGISIDPVAQSDPKNVIESSLISNEVTISNILQSSAESSFNQVTSISQLSDVQPSDWAFQALQSLVERYGCIAGYPDGTYRGQRALTRFEFAAGLNACLDRISELIAASTADLATQEDLATLQRLQEEFAAELASLRGRVDSLEARTAELEENQFSTTTVLHGEAIFAVAVPIAEDDSAFSDQTIGGYRVRLNFDTSFTGEDLLRARLQARNFDTFDGLSGLTPGLNWRWGGNNPSNDIVLDSLFYSFPVGDKIQVNIAANAFGGADFVSSTISPLDSGGQAALTQFGRPAQYISIPTGTGAGAIIQLTDELSFDFGYSAREAGNASNGAGLFNGDYGAIAQLTYLSDFVDAAVTYSNSYNTNQNFLTTSRPQVLNTYGAQVNFKIADWLQIGGGVAYAPTIAINRGSYDIWSYQVTLAFSDLG